MIQPKESIDLMNVDYDDVLQLYRGWRKSESALKDKSKELNALKIRAKQLQDSHVKFRGQIQALESVKELTVSLQSQLSLLQQENRQLVKDNRELAELNIKAEDLISEKIKSEEKQGRLLHEIQMQFATLKGRYEETLTTQLSLEQHANEEQAKRLSAESRMHHTLDDMDNVKEENQSLRLKLESTMQRLNQCDQELAQASSQLSSLSREVENIAVSRSQAATAEAELATLKGDVSRLLRLVEFCPGNRDFFEMWQDSGGVVFVGMDSVRSETVSGNGSGIGTGQFVSMGQSDISPAEFAHLKKLHGTDPFPMTHSTAEEAEFWVPSAAAKLGMQFLSSKVPHAPQKVIMDFLRNMNKIWLKRERRKIKRVKEIFGEQIAEMKRKMSQSKPYKGVLAERQIRRLKHQHIEDRKKLLSGKPRSSLDEVCLDEDVFESTDQMDNSNYYDNNTLDDYDNNNMLYSFGDKRMCKVLRKSSELSKADVQSVSKNKLLEASLNSLESLSRKMHITGGMTSTFGSSIFDNNGNNNDDNDFYQDSPNKRTLINSKYPNEHYLKGALWFGRNLSMVVEDLADEMDKYRSKFISEVGLANSDSNPRRSAHRLNLLATAGVTESLALVNKTKNKTRSLLQSVSSLSPGDTVRFHNLLQSMPIESSLSPDHNLRNNNTNYNNKNNYNFEENDLEDLDYENNYNSSPLKGLSISTSSVRRSLSPSTRLGGRSNFNFSNSGRFNATYS